MPSSRWPGGLNAPVPRICWRPRAGCLVWVLEMAQSVTLSGLRRHFAGTPSPALAGLDLAIAPGETLVLVGPSGCGKSTTLRLVAGLDRADAGTIQIGDRDVSRVPPQDRDVAMVFQGFALYPHLRVREILAFPLRMRAVPRAERDARVRETAELLALTGLLERRPAQLSGGEQQRVAMGRAIIRRPEVFLFDEPLSNLDAALRASLRIEVKRLLARLGATALYVTHDQTEAMTLGDRIAVLRGGHLEQVAAARQIYEAPATAFVAGFFGAPPMNLLTATRAGGLVHLAERTIPGPTSGGDRLLVGLRPESLQLAEPTDPRPGFVGEVTATEMHGAESHVTLALAGGEGLRLRVAGFTVPALGSMATVVYSPADLHWFDAETGSRL